MDKTPAQSNRLKRLRSQKSKNQKTMTNSMSQKSKFSKNSSDFADDHDLVYDIFKDLRMDKLNKNFKGIASSLVSLVDLLRDMTQRKD